MSKNIETESSSGALTISAPTATRKPRWIWRVLLTSLLALTCYFGYWEFALHRTVALEGGEYRWRWWWVDIDGLKGIDDAGLKRIIDVASHVWNVRSIYLSESRVTDEGLKTIDKLSSLQNLYLAKTGVTSSVLGYVKGLKHLSWLDLSDTKVQDGGLEQLGEIGSLRKLYLGYTMVTDNGMEHIAVLSKLESLYLRGTQIEDKSLFLLRNHNCLTWLDISETRVQDSGVAYLADIPNLKTLYLLNTKVTDTGVLKLKKLRKLEFLYCLATRVTSAAVQQLSKALPSAYIYSDQGNSILGKYIPIEKPDPARPGEKPTVKVLQKKARQLALFGRRARLFPCDPDRKPIPTANTGHKPVTASPSAA